MGTFIWQKRTSPDARKRISTAHEYLLCHASDINQLNDSIKSIWWRHQNPIRVEHALSKRFCAIYFFDLEQVQSSPTSPTRSTVCQPQPVHARQTFSPIAFLSKM